MVSNSLKRTLFIYLTYAFLVSSILTIITLLMEYLPSTKHDIQKFGIGALVLNSILWSFLFTISGSTSLLNTRSFVRQNFVVSLLCFLLLPILALIIIVCFVKVPQDLFGIAEAAIVFLIVQLFFFFKFRSCMNRNNLIAIDWK